MALIVQLHEGVAVNKCPLNHSADSSIAIFKFIRRIKWGHLIDHFEGDRLCGHWQIADRLGVYRQVAG